MLSIQGGHLRALRPEGEGVLAIYQRVHRGFQHAALDMARGDDPVRVAAASDRAALLPPVRGGGGLRRAEHRALRRFLHRAAVPYDAHDGFLV